MKAAFIDTFGAYDYGQYILNMVWPSFQYIYKCIPVHKSAWEYVSKLISKKL